MQFSYRRSRTDGPVLPVANNRRQAGEKNVYHMNRTARGHFVAMTGEFVGTTLFLFFALSGTQIANTIIPAGTSGDVSGQLFFIALSFGFSLMVTVWVFYRISGGLFNPAVG